MPALTGSGLILLAACLGADPVRGTTPGYEPTSSYSVETVEGWRLYVGRQLAAEGQTADRVRGLLRVKLYDIGRAVPGAALAKLRQVPIWLELANHDVRCACYHPSRDWLAGHGFNPDKAKAVEIGNARTFLAWSIPQPSMVLHELAHAYHDRFLGGHANPEIAAAYGRAMASKRYESVLYQDGTRKQAYAMRNPAEYFAELSEAWFGTNDFYPFVRAEVADFDPEMAALLQRQWKAP